MTRPALTDFRRIVVKVGSSLLVDSDAGEVTRGVARRARRRHRRAARRRPRRAGRLVRRDRARRAAVLKLPHGPLKLEESQAAAAVGQIALARTWAEVLGAPRHHRRPDPGDAAATPRSAAAISTPARPSASCWNGARCRSSTRTTRWPPPRSATATTTASPPASPPWRAPTCWCCCPTSTASTTRRPAPIPNAKLIPGRATHHRRDRGHGRRRRLRTVARRHAHQDRGGKIATTAGTHMVIASGQDRPSAAAIADGARCTWFLTPANPVTARKTLDRRLARAEGHADHRRRRGRGAARRQEPAAGRRDPRRRRVRPRRRRGRPRPRRPRDRPRPRRLRRRRRRADQGPLLAGHRWRSSASAGRAEMIHRDDLVLGGPTAGPFPASRPMADASPAADTVRPAMPVPHLAKAGFPC